MESYEVIRKISSIEGSHGKTLDLLLLRRSDGTENYDLSIWKDGDPGEGLAPAAEELRMLSDSIIKELELREKEEKEREIAEIRAREVQGLDRATLNRLGKNIQCLMKANRERTSDLAAALGFSVEELFRVWRLGPPFSDVLLRLADHYHVSEDSLLHDSFSHLVKHPLVYILEHEPSDEDYEWLLIPRSRWPKWYRDWYIEKHPEEIPSE